MLNKDLFYFTGSCLALDEHPGFGETIRVKIASGEINLDDFILLCSNHLVLPAIFLQFKKHGLLDIFPEEYLNHIAAIALQNKKRNLDVLLQINEINRALALENIEPVYLKGTALLLDTVYSEVGERMIGDIDLLVQEKDYLRSVYVIMKLGYQTDGKIYYDINTAKHFPRLCRTNVPNDIEIHRLPVDKEFSKQFNSAFIFRNKIAIPDMTNCFVPSDEHKVIHNFIHSQLGNSGFAFRQVSLRDFYDLYLLSKRVSIKSVIELMAEKQKAVSFFSLVARLFDLKNDSFPVEEKYALQYCNKVDWYLNHPRCHRRYIFGVKVYLLIFKRFIPGVGSFFISRSFRRDILKYVTDPDWYKMVNFRIRNFYKNYVSG